MVEPFLPAEETRPDEPHPFLGYAMVHWFYFVAIDRLAIGVALLTQCLAPARGGAARRGGLVLVAIVLAQTAR